MVLHPVEERSSAPLAELPASKPGAPRLVLILGAPRSGTTWLGKIFDSHPSVIYRHEPDEVLPPTDFPTLCPIAEIPRFADLAGRHVARLTAVRQLKASGIRPIFAKPFQPLPAPWVRRALAIGLRVAEGALPRARWPKQVAIPDFISGDPVKITYVIKSVSLLGATALLASALPESRIIVIFRHPCGQLASLKRGITVKTMGVGYYFGSRVLATPRARELGLTRESHEALPLLDRWLYEWALVHAMLLKDAEGFANVRLVRYEDLCERPIQIARELAAFSGLPWAEEVADFIRASTRNSRREGYYSLFRNPMVSATKWKNELPAEDVKRYMAIVSRVIPGVFPSDLWS